ncbi:armadillo-type protein [Lipomyces mesembrius]
MTDDVQLSSQYTPLGGSIWRRTSIPPANQSIPPQQQQPPIGAPYKQIPALTRSISLSLGPAPVLSPAEAKWSVPAFGGHKRNQSSNGSTSGSSGWSPERGTPDPAPSSGSSYGAVGTPLSAHSREFTPAIHSQQMQINSATPSSSTATYMALTEPINYRHLLERSVNCNWEYIVDKIVNNNDQQASIFLQQKLKIGSAEQKFSIIEAISEQAYQLMVNRFGNFLVQRCFEHGTPEQIEGIANAIKGNVLSLAMDAFGCHVVQKALDCVDESIKSEMVMELLRRVADTVVHRYACHVWQKLFELRWDDTPPAIMSYVNRELTGMWTQVALGETGSLVVQNIFENCVEEDKRPCIEEVIENLDVIARGQWGNWVIQHMIEHGSPEDANRALDIIIYNAAAYSMDQFASKVIEKLLKCSGADVVDRYLARICDGRPERPRIPLIDIASDAHGNYLIQYVLHNATKSQRDLVAAQIRKHMVSLRGSKWGSKCAWIVERYRNQSAIGSPAGGPPGSTGGVSIAGSAGQLSGVPVTGPHHHHHHHGGHHHKDRRTQYNLM